MPFVATWIDLEKKIIERQIWYHLYVEWNLKYHTNEFIYKIKTNSQI